MIRFPELERHGVTAAFSEKSDGDFSLKNAADLAAALGARRAFCRTCAADEKRLVCARQVHSARVEWVSADDAGHGALDWDSGIEATDGLITREPALPIGILVADCVPLYLVDTKRKAIALAHAGREGTHASIAEHALTSLLANSGSVPNDVFALIGPSAGPCCYEVSSELAEDFANAGLPVQGRRLDLWEANVLQLVRCGVPRANISVSGLCTICDGRFHSYRSGDATARNIALLML